MGRTSSNKKDPRCIDDEPILKFEWRNVNDVYICDPSDGKMTEMVEFCDEHGLKLKSYDNTDVSDCSGQWDTIACFRFENSEDALVFKLKFK